MTDDGPKPPKIPESYSSELCTTGHLKREAYVIFLLDCLNQQVHMLGALVAQIAKNTEEKNRIVKP